MQNLIRNRLYYVTSFDDSKRYIYKHGGKEFGVSFGWYWTLGSEDTKECKFYEFHKDDSYQFELLGKDATFEDYIKNKPFNI